MGFDDKKTNYRFTLLILISLLICKFTYSTEKPCEICEDLFNNDISIANNGKVLSWITKDSVYTAICDNPAVHASVPLKYRSCQTGNQIELSGDGNTIFWKTWNGHLFYGLVKSGKIFKPEELEITNLATGMSVNFQGTTVAGATVDEGKGKCAPNWFSPVVIKIQDGCWRAIKLFAIDICAPIPFTLLDVYGTITFSHGNNSLYQFSILNKDDFAVKDISVGGFNLVDLPISKDGEMLLLWRKRYMQSSHDSVASLFYRTLKGGSWSDPLPLLPEHRESILHHSVISPNGNHIAWMHYFRDTDGNEFVKQQVFVVHKLKVGWSKPEPLFTIPEIWISKLEISNTNVFIATMAAFPLYYYTTLDSIGELYKISLNGTEKIFKGDCSPFNSNVK